MTVEAEREYMKIQKNSAILLGSGLLAVAFCLINILFGFEYENTACIFLLVLSVELILWSKNNFLMLIIMGIMAYCNYSIVFAEYLHVIEGTMFTKYAGTFVAQKSIYIMLLFEAVLCCLLSFIDNSRKIQVSSENMADTLYRGKIVRIFVLLSNIVLLFILIFGFKRPDTLGDRGSPSAIYEYSIIIFILCFYFGNKYKWCKCLTSCMLALYAIQNFVFGGRITGLQLLIVAYVMMLESRWSLKKVLPIIIAGFLAMSMIGVARGAILSGDFSINGIIKILKERMFTLDTAYSSYHTSITFILMEEQVSMWDRIHVFCGFLKSIIVGGYDSVESNVARVTAQFYQHYDGGVLPFYFHYYFGWIGVPMIAGYLALIMKMMTKLTRKTQGLGKCICVYLVASTFRWYIYSPIQITRGILLLTVCYCITEKIIKSVLRKKQPEPC